MTTTKVHETSHAKCTACHIYVATTTEVNETTPNAQHVMYTHVASNDNKGKRDHAKFTTYDAHTVYNTQQYHVHVATITKVHETTPNAQHVMYTLQATTTKINEATPNVLHHVMRIVTVSVNIINKHKAKENSREILLTN